MMNYKLKKDLPNLKAGAVFIEHPSFANTWICDENDQKYAINAIEDTEWFEPIPERIELHCGSTANQYVYKKSDEFFTSKERDLMEKAINGELFTKDDMIRAYDIGFNSPKYTQSGHNQKHKLKWIENNL